MNVTDFGFGALDEQLWTLLILSIRCGAALMAAPMFGMMSVPVTIRALFGFVLALFIMSWMPVPDLPPMLSLEAMLIVLQEALIGVALGFVLQIAFAIPLIAAEQISGTMGLAIATSVDPNTGAQSGAIGQYFSLLMTLIFLSIGAHLIWLELILESYRALPPGLAIFTPERAMQVVNFAGLGFLTAAAIALPVVLVLLLVQIVTGVLSRSAPSLNLFALGLPAGVLAGLAALIASSAILFEQFVDLSELSLEQVGALVVAP
ncbi:flagellar biosynthetic protein FliR [Altererythrobacter lutimaris]|uniref:Flagellar biosynthetic protein FliR n=1 Tax=Altererythrobacter lutimaris TaxID=2743979 RepID=A0A850HA56_9SPHN|nr:flagellar biosynthetic protein FliR [Altererythrobacter lutimaris]NVE93328.1 flagellar biosynthetic protein FliR [Altererythrobacter lutimaris]